MVPLLTIFRAFAPGAKMSENAVRINAERRRAIVMLPKDLSRNRPVLLAGPTASGKSALAMEIAAQLGGPIVNADAMQVFADWRVLTARPSPADEARMQHALYGHVPGDQAYSVGQWLRDLDACLLYTSDAADDTSEV